MIQNKFTPKLHTYKIVLALLTILAFNDAYSCQTTQSAKSPQISQNAARTKTSLATGTPPYNNE